MNDKKKKKVSSKKNTPKIFLPETTKKKLLVAAIITFVVIVCGGYAAYETGLPARVLTGATVAGEKIKVNELNYRFFEAYNMYAQYGVFKSVDELDNLFDKTTGQTNREFLYEVAAQSQQNITVLNQEAQKAGYEALSADKKIDADIQSFRDYASSKNTTADEVLKSQYGAGITVRDLRAFMTREITAQEYAEYLKQTKYEMTQDQIKAMYDASPADYDKITFNQYFVAAGFATDASEEQKTQAVAIASAKAQAILDETTDPKSFRDASEKAAGTEGASSFADGGDPTLFDKASKADVVSYLSSGIGDFLFADDRKEGDTKVIETDSGAYAIYFQNRQQDTEISVSFRSLLVNGAEPAEAKTEAESYQALVTDENSFAALAKKYTDDTVTVLAGGLSSNVTKTSLSAEIPTEQEQALTEWLFSADRKAGDMTIIENTAGVTLYYYRNSRPAWESAILLQNADTQYKNWLTALLMEEENGYVLNKRALDFASY